MQVEQLVAGAGLLVVVLVIVLGLLPLIALWRMGTGLKMIAEALGNMPGRTTVATTFKNWVDDVYSPGAEGKELDAVMAQVANGKDLAEAAKAQAEATAALTEQAKLAVQWYVHSLQPPENGKPAKK